ncbi:HIRA-interacting protein 3 [Thalassophryne amazonica]|uniref:HIRA-interacting protein 3 n=1 Tax=Thalassophryne amazonica TaxID=390379 RepID=UPI0014713D47|nr:HIRA-interacting protein 3 [Thalassophryne amazonica]
MVSGKEAAKIRTFVREQLRDDPDLSSLTIGILKKQYLALVGRESLSADAKKFLKQVVEEELLKMQVSDSSGKDLETETEPQKKRAREKENGNVCKTGPSAKRSRQQSNSSDSEASEDCKSEREESDEDQQIKNPSGTGQQHKKTANQIIEDDKSSEESTDEMNMTDKHQKKVNESTCDDGPKEMGENGSKSAKSGKKKSSTRVKENASPGDEENEANTESSSDEETGKIPEEKNDELAQDSDSSSSDSLEDERESEKREKMNKKKMTSKKDESEKNSKSEKDADNESDGSSEHDGSESDDGGAAKISVEKKNDEPAQDSDSSESVSVEDEQESEPVKKIVTKKKKTTEKESGKTRKSQKDDNKAIVRLKRYISLCGVRHNYKKLFDGCRSVRSMVAVLKKELEDLGVTGRPSVEKCKKVRLKRERAQELAELDVSNIITTQGRPRRRGASALEEHRRSPQPSTYHRSLNSSSDSDQDHTARRHKKATDWSNLQGIISDDADSN